MASSAAPAGVPLLSERISQQYPKYKVVNASISGDTTSGGVARLPALLRQHAPAVVVLGWARTTRCAACP